MTKQGLFDDGVIFVYNQSLHAVINFSTGYFLYDTLDMFANRKSLGFFSFRGRLIHHLVCLAVMQITVLTGKWMLAQNIFFIVEIQSVFMHLRSLGKMAGIDQNDWRYQSTVCLNILTFLICRCTIYLWTGHFILLCNNMMPLTAWAVSALGLCWVVIFSLQVFVIVLKSDADIIMKMCSYYD